MQAHIHKDCIKKPSAIYKQGKPEGTKKRNERESEKNGQSNTAATKRLMAMAMAIAKKKCSIK